MPQNHTLIHTRAWALSTFLLLLLTAACESDEPTQSHDASVEDAHMAEKSEKVSSDKAATGFGPDADVFEWKTGEFKLEPGQEQYLCYASTLDQDMVVNGFASEVAPFVHHLIFSRARAPEPDGFAECDVTFRNSWEPLFLSGAGNTKLEFPDDAGSVMTAGTQLVLQMHLLNTSDKPVSSTTLINMRRTSIENPRRVSTAVFGTAAVELPANKESEVVGTCAVKQDIQLIAGFPHMHLLGTGLRFEIGKSTDKLEEVFKRDPYDFDNQRIDKLDVKLSAGDMARVSCTYNNTHDQTISYGESTLNEMCYFIGFAVDSRGGCLEVTPPATKR